MDLRSENNRDDLLVIGYGNTLRSDDAVGRRVAEALQELRLPGVRVLSCYLLTPELADPISKARRVVFVDASVQFSETAQLRAVEPAECSPILAHTAEPGTLLALARDLFGSTAQAWWLTIPVSNMELGEALSQKAREGVRMALEKIRQLVNE